jgi:aspartyl-tRNA(Asn)/glutamyl-tRNA(Gln) amidotransferase subunit C
MTKITKDTVDKLATLSRLEFDGRAKEEILGDLNRMLDFVGKLNELNTEGVEPLIYMTEDKNVLRADEVKRDISQKDALKNAPKHDSDYFKVPKVVEKK